MSHTKKLTICLKGKKIVTVSEDIKTLLSQRDVNDHYLKGMKIYHKEDKKMYLKKDRKLVDLEHVKMVRKFTGAKERKLDITEEGKYCSLKD